jgi:hypothetical protein
MLIVDDDEAVRQGAQPESPQSLGIATMLTLGEQTGDGALVNLTFRSADSCLLALPRLAS